MNPPDLSLDSQTLAEASSHMQMKRKYSSDLRERFRSVPFKEGQSSSFQTVVVPMRTLLPPSTSTQSDTTSR